jgi:glycosyltransferase involved in cell wall biosynthesis
MKLFVLLPRFPYPLDKGDKLRAFFQLRELSKRHEITLCALSHEPVSEGSMAAVAPFCKRIEVVRLSAAESARGVASAALVREPFQAGYFYSARAHRIVKSLVAETRPDHAYFQLVRTARYARGLDVPLTLDFMDAFSWSTRRMAEHQRGPVGLLRSTEAARLLDFEGQVLERVSRGSIISVQDRDRIASPRRDRLLVVPNGVDLETFKPRALEPRFDLLFVGHMSYPPNVAAADTLAREILPLVRKHIPHATLRIAGTSPAASVLRLRSDHVEVPGWVEDMPACYASARVFVAPISIGAGMPNKVLQALAMGLPVVATPDVSGAIEGSAEVLRVSPTPEGIAGELVELLRDPNRARQIGEAGRALAESRFRWDRTTLLLEELFARAS